MKPTSYPVTWWLSMAIVAVFSVFIVWPTL